MPSLPIIKFPNHKTKIIATIGPATNTPERIQKLITAGMTIARLNFSHGTLTEHKKQIAIIKQLAKKNHKIIPILIDLPGIKIRLGKLVTDPLMLKPKDTIVLTTQPKSTEPHILPVQFKELPHYVQKNDHIYVNDGFIELKVTSVSTEEIHCIVTIGGIVRSYKGINLPHAKLRIESITPNDLKIIKFGLQQNIAIFSLSFIESVEDIHKVRNHFPDEKLYLIAKIERKEALDNFDQIVPNADGIMIARGDLGIQVPLEKVPLIQKQLIQKANLAGKPVITATQMLKSMTDNTRPTRAEVTDVANAIIDGTDAIMLSEETAIGKYPIDAVKIMAKIAAATEKNNLAIQRCHRIHQLLVDQNHQTKLSVADVISLNVTEAQDIINPRYILVTTSSGTTARRVSRFKPRSWILTFSQHSPTCQFLPFSYGVYPVQMRRKGHGWHDQVIEFITQHKLVNKNDIVLLTQRRFSEERGGTDSLGIITIESSMLSPSTKK